MTEFKEKENDIQDLVTHVRIRNQKDWSQKNPMQQKIQDNLKTVTLDQ